MISDWEIVESGPPDAERTVLLLPGGMNSARSYAEIMAEPVLSGIRLVAATLPGHVGTPAPDHFSIEANARAASQLANDLTADVVMGFSMGAAVAFEMVVSGAFAGPVVLAGISLSAADEPAFFRGIVRSTAVLGSVPVTLLKKGAVSFLKRADIPVDRQEELRADLEKNDGRVVRHALSAYVDWLHRYTDPAQRLCDTGVPAWFVHAEKGDGGLTDHEKSVMEGCSQIHLVTLPGEVFFLPNEASAPIAEVIAEAVAQSGASNPPR
ncbi:MAG TPA: alpha/beta hydrolase [Actinomycetes bacterium]|nr:alpha/beta hydrolase [Actinomycetes bacterium]